MNPDVRQTGYILTPENKTTLVTAWYGDQLVTTSAQTVHNAIGDLSKGTMLGGRYRIDIPVGVGGFATVYSAWDTRMRRWVAVKIYPETAGVIPLDEARLQGAVQHPNLMPLYDNFTDPLAGVTGLVMPLYPGCDLQEMIESYGPLSFRMALNCIDQLCSAVEFLWQRRQMMHGDIKPGNIWVTGSGAALLMDFNTPGQMVRNPTFRLGTPGYTAPEVFHGQGDLRSDVFSLGCVLYTCLAGASPYANDVEALAGRFIPLVRLRPDIRPQLADAIQKAIHPNPEMRYASTRQFKTALRMQRYRRPSQIWGFVWDFFAIIFHLLWRIICFFWRALRHLINRLIYHPRQAVVELLLLIIVGWFAWQYGTILWQRYQLPAILISGGVMLLTIIGLLARRRRWW